MSAASLVLMALVGGAGLLAMVISSYFLTLIIDKCCPDPSSDRIFSPVSNRAGLWGMSYKERLKVLEQLFTHKKTIKTYQDKGDNKPEKAPTEIEMTEIKSTPIKEAEGETTHEENRTDTLCSDCSSQTTEGDAGDKPHVDGGDPASADHDENDVPNGVLKAQHEFSPEHIENLCSICLVEYSTFFSFLFFLAAQYQVLVYSLSNIVPPDSPVKQLETGDRVMSGTACSHLFHVDCIMEWMQKVGLTKCGFIRQLWLLLRYCFLTRC